MTMDKAIEKKIKLDSGEIAYCLRTSARARRLRVTIKPGGKMTVTRPLFFGEGMVEDFLRQKSNWVVKHFKASLGRRPALSRRERKENFAKHKNAALARVREIISRANGYYGFKFGAIAIRDQATRWGSCSGKGNLNFNYRVALLPGRLADYVVIHELCHLKEMNHSQRFWDLVARAVPDHRAARKELRKFFADSE